MNKKIIAIVLELIPVVSAVVSFYLFTTSKDSALIRKTLLVSFVFSLLGIAFFIVGRKLAGDDKTVRILGLLDLVASIYVIAFYVLAIISFGL
ncbi:MAG: hypothetical protein IJH60_01925 [Eubacterium sp.]|nr:hypothetical protein [Eubacterium sp.]